MASFLDFKRHDVPFLHWVDTCFLSREQVAQLNKGWVDSSDKRWHHERRDYSKKSALMFPRRLHDSAQALAEELYSAEKVGELSELTGIDLLPDPWFAEGPMMPRVGGGLHEIHPEGALKMHVDFSVHPTGLTRSLNLLLYLNEEWQEKWGGALELGEDRRIKIFPYGGTAVVFQTNGTSWHGHPSPLACPPHKTRRSLALYYYSKLTPDADRPTTVYQNEN